jgi:hypothetical protein
VHTFTASRRAVAATSLGIAMSLSFVGCSRDAGLDARSEAAVGDTTHEPSAPPSPASPSASPMGPSSPTHTGTPAGGPTATPGQPSQDPRALEGCSLLQFHGNLVAENGGPVLKTLGYWGTRAGTVTLDWPEGWTIRPADGEQFEVLDRDGAIRARTGTRVILLTPDYLNVYNRDGEFIVCDDIYGVHVLGDAP